ncbi:MAG: bifunctional riboflavin kinase/FAD synthetase [Clostridia bacterium]|nr:bifunctional riboflavin kinase/FAD synthetase [Clostridia bacterium]
MQAPLLCISLKDGAVIPTPPSLILCLGNFDGLHVAHRQLLARAKKLRDSRFPSAVCGVFCFSQPPLEVLNQHAPAQLFTAEQKLAAFSEAGMEVAILADFSALRDLTPKAFVKEILLEQCHTVAAVCGFNYHFGKGGVGDASLLSSLLDTVEVVEEVPGVSSSLIRSLLYEGKIEQANALLTRPYSLCAPVVHGKGLGRNLGTPTVNQQFPKSLLIPRHGVYLTSCQIGEASYFGISNVGVRPTVDQDGVANCETYLFDFDGTLYGKELTVCFLKFLRPEQKFSSKEELMAQIQKDIEQAEKALKELK